MKTQGPGRPASTNIPHQWLSTRFQQMTTMFGPFSFCLPRSALRCPLIYLSVPLDGNNRNLFEPNALCQIEQSRRDCKALAVPFRLRTLFKQWWERRLGARQRQKGRPRALDCERNQLFCTCTVCELAQALQLIAHASWPHKKCAAAPHPRQHR